MEMIFSSSFISFRFELLKTGDSCSFCWFPTRQPVQSFRFVFSFLFFSSIIIIFFPQFLLNSFVPLMNVPLEL